MLITEVGRPKAKHLANVLVAGLLSSSVAFAVFFPMAGDSFVGLYDLTPFTYHDWQLAAAIPIGLLGAALALVTVVAIRLCTKLTERLIKQSILRPIAGGTAFGLIGVALPLTLFTGDSALKTVIDQGPVLGAGLLTAVVFAKIFTFAISQSTGFIGGPFFGMLFIGGTAGAALHPLIPGLPEALTFSTLSAAMPGSLVAALFSLLLLAVLTTQIGTLQTAPIAIGTVARHHRRRAPPRGLIQHDRLRHRCLPSETGLRLDAHARAASHDSRILPRSPRHVSKTDTRHAIFRSRETLCLPSTTKPASATPTPPAPRAPTVARVRIGKATSSTQIARSPLRATSDGPANRRETVAFVDALAALLQAATSFPPSLRPGGDRSRVNERRDRSHANAIVPPFEP